MNIDKNRKRHRANGPLYFFFISYCKLKIKLIIVFTGIRLIFCVYDMFHLCFTFNDNILFFLMAEHEYYIRYQSQANELN